MTPILDSGERSVLLPTSEGEFTLNTIASGWEAAPERQFRVKVVQRPVYADQWGYEFVAEFIRAICQGGKTTVSIHDAYRVMQIIDASYESSRTGRRIELNSSLG